MRITSIVLVLFFAPRVLIAQPQTSAAQADAARAESPCPISTYYQILSSEFAKPLNGRRLATVEVLPSFTSEYAIAIERSYEGVVVTRIAYRKQLWQQLGLMSPPQKTQAHCTDVAKNAEIDRSTIPIAPDVAQHLLDELFHEDFKVDSCPRSPKGNCAHLMDGVLYIITVNDGRSVQITDVSRMPDYKSENPALSNWVTELFQAIDSAK
jgi:hypothetical protein